MAPGDFDQFFLPRHIGLYAGVPVAVPAIMAQRICGTGFELFRQAGEHIQGGACEAALVVGTESMTRNPIAAFDHRTGFKLGAPVGFKDYMWEALKDPAAGINMIQTAENLARKYGITREQVDEFAHQSFAKAVAAQESGFLAGEIVPVVTEKFELDGYKPRGIKLQGKVTEVAQDTHPRPRPSRYWPSCAQCSKAACRPAATRRHWWMPPPPPWSPRARMRRRKASSRWRASSAPPPSACRPRSWASAPRRPSACCWSARD